MLDTASAAMSVPGRGQARRGLSFASLPPARVPVVVPVPQLRDRDASWRLLGGGAFLDSRLQVFVERVHPSVSDLNPGHPAERFPFICAVPLVYFDRRGVLHQVAAEALVLRAAISVPPSLSLQQGHLDCGEFREVIRIGVAEASHAALPVQRQVACDMLQAAGVQDPDALLAHRAAFSEFRRRVGRTTTLIALSSLITCRAWAWDSMPVDLLTETIVRNLFPAKGSPLPVWRVSAAEAGANVLVVALPVADYSTLDPAIRFTGRACWRSADCSFPHLIDEVALGWIARRQEAHQSDVGVDVVAPTWPRMPVDNWMPIHSRANALCFVPGEAGCFFAPLVEVGDFLFLAVAVARVHASPGLLIAKRSPDSPDSATGKPGTIVLACSSCQGPGFVDAWQADMLWSAEPVVPQCLHRPPVGVVDGWYLGELGALPWARRLSDVPQPRWNGQGARSERLAWLAVVEQPTNALRVSRVHASVAVVSCYRGRFHCSTCGGDSECTHRVRAALDPAAHFVPVCRRQRYLSLPDWEQVSLAHFPRTTTSPGERSLRSQLFDMAVSLAAAVNAAGHAPFVSLMSSLDALLQLAPAGAVECDPALRVLGQRLYAEQAAWLAHAHPEHHALPAAAARPRQLVFLVGSRDVARVVAVPIACACGSGFLAFDGHALGGFAAGPIVMSAHCIEDMAIKYACQTVTSFAKLWTGAVQSLGQAGADPDMLSKLVATEVGPRAVAIGVSRFLRLRFSHLPEEDMPPHGCLPVSGPLIATPGCACSMSAPQRAQQGCLRLLCDGSRMFVATTGKRDGHAQALDDQRVECAKADVAVEERNVRSQAEQAWIRQIRGCKTATSWLAMPVALRGRLVSRLSDMTALACQPAERDLWVPYRIWQCPLRIELLLMPSPT